MNCNGMMHTSCGGKHNQRRVEHELWRKELSDEGYSYEPTNTEDKQEEGRQRSSYNCDRSHYQKPDICYPEFNSCKREGVFKLNEDDENYYSSSPLLYEQKDSQKSICKAQQYDPSVTESLTKSNRATMTNKQDLEDFFGEKFPGMEETFRSVLLQYFTQVDKEKECLSEDLKRIKDDFYKYEREGKKIKIDSIQKGKVIRKLTENGKLFVREIERLRNELNDVQLVRRHLVEESNEMQKKLNFEGNTIPRLEKELKTLSEENNYLKLLSEDTEKLSKQEVEIRKHLKQIEHQKKILNQQAGNLEMQSNTIKKLTNINEELASEVNELKKLNKELDETKQGLLKKIDMVQYNNRILQEKYQDTCNHFKDLKNREKSMEKELRKVSSHEGKLEKMIGVTNNKQKELEEHCTELEEKIIEKDAIAKDLDCFLKDLSNKYDLQTKDLRHKEDTISIMNEENCELNKEKEGLRKALKMLEIDTGRLTYKDELKAKELELLSSKFINIETDYRELAKKEQRQQNEISRYIAAFETHEKTEVQYRERIQELQVDLNKKESSVHKIHLDYEEKQNEYIEQIISLESELKSAQNTINCMHEKNKLCIEERSVMYKELLAAKKQFFAVEEVAKTSNENLKKIKDKYQQLQSTYIQCESQKSELEKTTKYLPSHANIQDDFFKHKQIKMDELLQESKCKIKELEEELSYSKNDIRNLKYIIETIKINSYEIDVERIEIIASDSKQELIKSDRKEAIKEENKTISSVCVPNDIKDLHKHYKSLETQRRMLQRILINLQLESQNGDSWTKGFKETLKELTMCNAELNSLKGVLLENENFDDEQIRFATGVSYNDMFKKIESIRRERDDFEKKTKHLKEMLTQDTFQRLQKSADYDTAQYIDELHQLYETCEIQKDQLEKELIVLKEQLSTNERSILSSEKENEEVLQRLSITKEEVRKKETELNESKKERHKIEKKFMSLQYQYASCDKERAKLHEDIKLFKDNYYCASNTLQDQEKLLDELLAGKNKTDEFNEHLVLSKNAGSREIDELHEMYTTCEKQRNQLQKDVLTLRENCTSFKKKASQFDELKKQLDHQNGKLSTLRTEIISKETNIIKYEKEKNDYEKLLQEFQEKLKTCENKKLILKEEITFLKEKNTSASNTIENQEELMDKLIIVGKELRDDDSVMSADKYSPKFDASVEQRNRLQRELLILQENFNSTQLKHEGCVKSNQALIEEIVILKEELQQTKHVLSITKTKIIHQKKFFEEERIKLLKQFNHKHYDEFNQGGNNKDGELIILGKEMKITDSPQDDILCYIEGLHKKYNACESQRNRLQKELLALQESRQKNETNNEIDKLKMEVNSLKDELLVQKNSNFILSNDKNDIDEKCKDIQRLYDSCKEERNKLTSEIQACTEKHVNALIAHSDLDTLNREKNRFGCLSCTKQSKTNMISGFNGDGDTLSYIEDLEVQYEFCENHQINQHNEIFNHKKQNECLEKVLYSENNGHNFENLQNNFRENQKAKTELDSDKKDMNKILEDFQKKHTHCDNEKMKLLEELNALKKKHRVIKAMMEDQENVIREYEIEVQSLKGVLSAIEKPLEIDEKGDIGFEFANKEDFDALIASYYACDNQRLNLLNELLNLKKCYHNAERNLLEFETVNQQLKQCREEQESTKRELETALHLIDSYQNTSESTAADSNRSNIFKETEFLKSKGGCTSNGVKELTTFKHYSKEPTEEKIKRPYDEYHFLSKNINNGSQNSINLDLIKAYGGPQYHHHEINENNSNHESGFEEISLKNLESFVSEKNSEINELSGENRLLQEDLEVILSEYNLLQETYEEVKQKLHQREIDIRDCEEYCEELENLVKDKTRIINELTLDQNAEEYNVQKQNEKEKRSANVVEKDICSDSEINDSDEEKKKIETSIVESFSGESLKKNKAENDFCSEGKDFAFGFSLDEKRLKDNFHKPEAFDIFELQDTISELKETIKKKDKTINDLRYALEYTKKHRDLSSDQDEEQVNEVNKPISYESAAPDCNSKNLQECDVVIHQTIIYNFAQILHENTGDSLMKKEKRRIIDLSNVLSVNHYRTRYCIDHIGVLNKNLQKLKKLNHTCSAIMSGKKINQGNNILPPIPNGNMYHQPRNQIGEIVDGKHNKETYSRESNAQNVSEEKALTSTDEMRRNMMRLNSDLLRKSIEINRLEDELREAIRKTDKVKESYRDSVSKNESFEEEITMNRKRIEEIQERHKSYELKENQYKRDIANLQLSLKQAKEKNMNLSEENNLLKRDIDVSAVTSNKIDNLESKNKHLKRKVAILETEIQTLTSNSDLLKDELSIHKEELVATKKCLLHVEKERDAIKSSSHLQQRETEDILQDNDQLKFEISEKYRVLEKLEEQIRRTQQNEEHINIKYNQTEINLKRIENKLAHSEVQNMNLQEKIAKLSETIKENQIAQMNYNSEREMAVRATRYLENRIDELQKEIDDRDLRLIKITEHQTETDSKVTRSVEELKTTNFEFQKISNNCSKYKENVEHLEKLNTSMNKENKRLMLDISTLKSDIKTMTEKYEARKQKLEMLEKEQSGLDNLVTKTQKSNSELLEGNRTINEELTNVKHKLKELSTSLKHTTKEKHEIERSLITTNEELQQAYESLSLEKKDILKELAGCRKMINEFEAILEQGQFDFDDMDQQLEKYRHENDLLDKKLHQTSKDNVKLQAEKDEINRRILILNDEMSSLKTQMDSQKRNCELCCKERENMELKFFECKSREEYFEERLMGYENIVHSKDDLILNEKKEKENIQHNVLKLQSELIVTKTQLQDILAEKEEKMSELTENSRCIENLQTSNQSLISSNNDLVLNLKSKEKLLSECNANCLRCTTECDKLESERCTYIHNLQLLESEIENEKLKRHNDKEALLAEISLLKRNFNESELTKEKQLYQQKSNDSALKETQKTNQILSQKVKELEKEKIEAKDKMIETVKQWQHKIQVIEEEKAIEIIEIKASLEAIEEARIHEISLLKKKVDRREGHVEIKTLLEKKNSDVETLKEDITQLQNILSKSDFEKSRLLKENDHYKLQINYLESNNFELDLEKKKLIEKIKVIEGKHIIYKEHQNTMTLEKIPLYDNKSLKRKDSDQQLFDCEIKSLKSKLNALEVVTEENESLKSDLDSILDERKVLIGENTQLRSENYDLRQSIEKIQDTMNENRLLKQQMRAAEVRQNETVDRINRENARLRRNVDELFKTIQELESQNANYIKSKNSLIDHQLKFNAPGKKKSVSVDMLDNVGLNTEAFSPLRYGIITSTPNQEHQKLSPITRAQSLEMPKKKDELRYDTDASVLHNENDDIKSTLKADASWHKPQDDKRPILSIKSNPFLKNDKILKSTCAIGMKSKSAPMIISKKPASTLIQTTNEVVMFDMRPQSADVTLKSSSNLLVTPCKSNADNLSHKTDEDIGSQFVNRLKQTFEKNQN